MVRHIIQTTTTYMKKAILLLSCIACASTTQAQCDLIMLDASPLEYSVPGTHSFNVTIQNIGKDGADFAIYWQQDKGIVQHITPANIPVLGGTSGGTTIPVGVQDAKFTVNFPSAGTYTLKTWIASVGTTDANHNNDTITHTIKVFESLPVKNVLLEVFKHFTCCPCYPAACYEDTIISKNKVYAIANIYSFFEDASVYSADGDTVDRVYNFGHPMPLLDRYKFPRYTMLNTQFENGVNGYDLLGYGEREQFYTPVSVSLKSASFNTTTRELRIKISAQFFDKMPTGDYRFNVYLTEDSIKGYQGCAPDPYNYYHMRVLRAMLGGSWGKAGSLPASLNKGDQKDYEFAYTIPADYNINRMNIIGFLQNYNSDIMKRSIINTTQVSFKNALTLSIPNTASVPPDIQAYPNPVINQLNIHFENEEQYRVIVTDITGKTLIKMQSSANTRIDTHTWAPGTYILKIDDAIHSYSKTIIKE